MRRGQVRPPPRDPLTTFTKQELLDACELSGKSFDTIRKASRVKGPSHGGLKWVFSAEDVVTMIKRAESGTFSERGGPPARAWRALLAERGIEIHE
ncbi:MAG: hypothetical protein ACT4PL_13845 [Phycisphaerales bacterium]